MTNIKEKFQSIEAFKKDFQDRIKCISYEELESNFYVENYFFNNKIPYIEKYFYETILEIVASILKNAIQELEYYVNIKPSTPISNSDYEILNAESEILEKYYLRCHILYKKYHKIHLTHKSNTKESIDYLKNSYKFLIEFIKYSADLQDKLITNIEKHLQELEKKDKQYENPLFN